MVIKQRVDCTQLQFVDIIDTRTLVTANRSRVSNSSNSNGINILYSHKNGALGYRLLGIGRGWPLETRPSPVRMGYHAEFDRSGSNGIGARRQIH